MTTLKKDPQNAKRHTPRNNGIIRQSLEEVGAFRSIAVDGDDIIRAGNGVYDQAVSLGLKIRIVEALPDELIAVRRADLTGERAQRAALYDNRAAETGELDEGVIALLASNEPQILEGILEGGELAALLEIADGVEKIEGDLAGEASGGTGSNKKITIKSGEKVRPVLVIGQVALFEEALRAVGNQNRGEALMEICRHYLETHRAEKSEG